MCQRQFPVNILSFCENGEEESKAAAEQHVEHLQQSGTSWTHFDLESLHFCRALTVIKKVFQSHFVVSADVSRRLLQKEIDKTRRWERNPKSDAVFSQFGAQAAAEAAEAIKKYVPNKYLMIGCCNP